MKVSLGDLKYLRRVGEGYFRTIPAAPHKPDPRHWRDDQLTLSWLGHATVLLNFFGVWILSDAALRARVGPLTFGPKRYVAPALRMSELPPLDFILLTHAHMDHLDVGTLSPPPARRDRYHRGGDGGPSDTDAVSSRERASPRLAGSRPM